jgi:hypothetical protein
MNKEGQLSTVFNWMYVAIAGGVILLFFVYIIVGQTSSSEQKLSLDLVQEVKKIFIGAGISERTTNIIPLNNLAEEVFYFECEEGVSRFGLKKGLVTEEDNINPIFSPDEIKSTELYLWSLPYNLPYKVTNLLFVSSAHNKYYYDEVSDELSFNFINSTKKVFNIEQLTDLVEKGSNYQARIIYFKGIGPVPEKLKEFGEKLTAVEVTESNVKYYYNSKGSWKEMGNVEIISINNKQPAALYAAIFSANPQMYQCNMMKAFKRLQYVNQIYAGNQISNIGNEEENLGGKLLELKNFYVNNLLKQTCNEHVQEMSKLLKQHSSNTLTCIGFAGVEANFNYCVNLKESASKIKELNSEMRKSCLTLY